MTENEQDARQVTHGDKVRYTGHLGGSEVAEVTDTGKHDTEPYIIVEYDDGETDIWYWDQYEPVEDGD